MWWKKAIIYELYVDKFAGDFRNLINKLAYLSALGINCIHILPHYPSPMVDDGYDVSDYRNVRKGLGTFSDFEEFIKRAHDLGIKIMIDLVLNHTSTLHPWFLEARSPSENPKRDYYLWSTTGKEFQRASNPFSFAKPSNWIYNPQSQSYYFSTFYPEQADLNWNNPKVLEEILSIIDFWVGFGVDSFRLDAVAHLVKKDGTSCKSLLETHVVIKKIRSYLDKYTQSVALLAEVSEPVNDLKAYFGDGDECQMVYHFLLAPRIFLAVLRNDKNLLSDIKLQSTDVPENCAWAVFLCNHDALAFDTLPAEARQTLIDYCDPAKQYAFEDGIAVRMATALRGDQKMIIEAFRLLFQFGGSPIIYYGEEIGMKNALLQSKVLDTRQYVRGKFDWEEVYLQMKDPSSLWNTVRSLIKERKNRNDENE